MKNTIQIIGLTILWAGALAAHAGEKITAGAKGGRLLENESPRAEFFLEKDRTISLTFYDKDLKAVPVAGQTAIATAETSEGKKKIEFEKKGDILVSTSPVPDGNGYTIVLQLKENPSAKFENFRIPLNTSICSKCHHPEYSCICGDD